MEDRWLSHTTTGVPTVRKRSAHDITLCTHAFQHEMMAAYTTWLTMLHGTASSVDQ
jgi:hypothetical protein